MSPMLLSHLASSRRRRAALQHGGGMAPLAPGSPGLGPWRLGRRGNGAGPALGLLGGVPRSGFAPVKSRVDLGPLSPANVILKNDAARSRVLSVLPAGYRKASLRFPRFSQKQT